MCINYRQVSKFENRHECEAVIFHASRLVTKKILVNHKANACLKLVERNIL